MYDKQIFADNLTHYMKMNNETQIDVAKLIGVSKSVVETKKAGSITPPALSCGSRDPVLLLSLRRSNVPLFRPNIQWLPKCGEYVQS